MALLPAELSVFLVGGKEDVALCERLAMTRPGSVNLAGALRFRETAALMQRAVHVFTNDSAPLHLASAVNAPVTAVFCSTRPELGFGPLSDNSRVVYSETPCCSKGIHGAKACPEGHFSCARSILPQQVLGDTFDHLLH
jgi:heptosyltransferase-2